MIKLALFIVSEKLYRKSMEFVSFGLYKSLLHYLFTINRTAVRRMVRTAVRTRKRMTQKRGRKRIPMKRRKCACQAWMEKKRLECHMTSEMWFNVGNMGGIGGGDD